MTKNLILTPSWNGPFFKRLRKYIILQDLYNNAQNACVCMLSHISHVQLFATLWAVAHQAPLSMGFSRQEYWSGLTCPSPGDLPDLGIEPWILHLLPWEAGSLPLGSPKKPNDVQNTVYHLITIKHQQISPRLIRLPLLKNFFSEKNMLNVFLEYLENMVSLTYFFYLTQKGKITLSNSYFSGTMLGIQGILHFI